MPEMKRIDELILRGTDHQTKFTYGMISLALGTLALSFQFSIKLKVFPYILVTSWVALFISVLLGGWRVYFLPAFLFANADILKDSLDISKYAKDPLYLDNLEFWQKERISQFIDSKKKNIQANEAIIQKRSSLAIKFYKAEVVFLIIGLFLLGLFTTLNYLSDSTSEFSSFKQSHSKYFSLSNDDMK